MGLAPYGEPIYKDRIKIIKNSDFFELNLKYFDHHKSVLIMILTLECLILRIYIL